MDAGRQAGKCVILLRKLDVCDVGNNTDWILNPFVLKRSLIYKDSHVALDTGSRIMSHAFVTSASRPLWRNW